ncbi:MAG: caspase family protein [Myxococcota bacterium]|jgi:hypothetical protein|nr:caspase family protein [Myxococcota bacterium]
MLIKTQTGTKMHQMGAHQSAGSGPLPVKQPHTRLRQPDIFSSKKTDTQTKLKATSPKPAEPTRPQGILIGTGSALQEIADGKEGSWFAQRFSQNLQQSAGDIFAVLNATSKEQLQMQPNARKQFPNTHSRGAATSNPNAQRYALMVAAHNYKAHPTLPSLPGTLKDIEILSQALEPLNFTCAHLINPNRNHFFDAAFQLIEKAAPGDEVLLWLSGHGQKDGSFVFSTTESPNTAVNVTQLLELEELAQARNIHFALVVDTCFSGQLANQARMTQLTKLWQRAKKSTHPKRQELMDALVYLGQCCVQEAQLINKNMGVPNLISVTQQDTIGLRGAEAIPLHAYQKPQEPIKIQALRKALKEETSFQAILKRFHLKPENLNSTLGMDFLDRWNECLEEEIVQLETQLNRH